MEKKIVFKSYDGTELVGILCTPTTEPTKGAFLLMHGIPSDKDEWGFYRDMVSTLQSNGYASLRFDFRCNGESSGGNITNLTLSALVNDIESAYYNLCTSIETNCPIFVVGTSCGGGVAVKWVNIFKHPVQKIFLMAPVLDYKYEIFGKDLENNEDPSAIIPSDWQYALMSEGHLDNEIPYGLSMVNEVRCFDADSEFAMLQVPVTIFHGDADTVVPYSKTQHIATKFSSKVSLVTVPDADHGFAVAGDDDLTAPGTKQNHYYVYSEMFKSIIM